MEKKKIYIHGLDGLKTIAIIGVTLYHIFPNTVKGGYLGVVLFFIISGFLLSYRTKIQWKEGSYSLGNYYIKRIKRIYPPLVIVLFCTIGVYYFLAKNAISAIRPEVISILLGYNNIWQIEQNADYFTRIANASPFTHLWYLSITLQFYLIWPVLFFIYKKLPKGKGLQFFGLVTIVSALEMLVLYVFGFDPTRMYYGTDTRIFALMIGVILGLIWVPNKMNKKINAAPVLFLISMALTVWLYFVLDGQSAILYCGGMFVISLLFAFIMILTMSQQSSIGALLDQKGIAWLGKHSFSIYLWQYPVIFLFNYKNWNNAFTYILQIVLILILTVLLDSFIEFLFSKEKRRLFSRQSVFYKRACAVLTVCLAISLVFGTKGMIESADTKTDTKLAETMSKNSEKLKEENEKAIEEAKNTEKTETTEEEEKKDYSKTSNSAKVSEDSVILLGDSVLLGASVEVEEALPGCHIDAVVSRFVGEEQAALQDFINAGFLKDTVVECMGTNGTLYSDVCEQTLSMIGEDHSVFWVNNYCPGCEWEQSNNEYLQQLADSHSNVTLVDWYSIASAHPEYLGEDGIHPNQEGCEAYAQMIKDALDKVIEEQKNV